MPEMMKQKALQLELVPRSYGAYKLFHTFPMEKPFNYNPLNLPSKHMFMTLIALISVGRYQKNQDGTVLL